VNINTERELTTIRGIEAQAEVSGACGVIDDRITRSPYQRVYGTGEIPAFRIIRMMG
jgi:hypothetical protein